MEPILRFSELTWNLFYVPHNVVGWAEDVLNHRVFSNQRCEAARSGLGLTPNFAKNPRRLSLEDWLDGGGGVGGWVGLDHVVAPFVLCV